MDRAQMGTLLNVTTIVVIMLAMGLKANINDVLATMRQPRLIFGSVLANFILVPLLAVVLLRLFAAEPIVSIGFLILAVCPGAPVSPPLTVLAKGNLPSAIGIMVFLACLSAVCTPLLLRWLLPHLAPIQDFHIDSLAILRTLLLVQLVPLGLGLIIQRLLPSVAQRASGPLSLLGTVLLLALLAVLLYTQFPSLAAIRGRAWCGMMLLLASSLAVGWISGGTSQEIRKSLALNTAIRNIAVGLVIVNGNFAATPAVTAVVAYGLVSMFGAAAFAGVVGRKHSPTTLPVGA